MFTPSISLDVLTKATVLRFTDETGVDTGDGSKWDGIAGISSAAVTAATLVVTDPNSINHTINCLATIAAAAPITANEDIVMPDLTGEWPDGYYSAVYNIWMAQAPYASVADYSGTVPGAILITDNGHAVVTGMKVTMQGTKYTGEYSAVRVDANTFYIIEAFDGTEAGNYTPYYSTTFTPLVYANVEMALERMYAVYAAMDEGPEADEYLDHAETVMGLYHVLKEALVTSSATIVNNIYGRITRILDFHSIELTYTA